MVDREASCEGVQPDATANPEQVGTRIEEEYRPRQMALGGRVDFVDQSTVRVSSSFAVLWVMVDSRYVT